MWIAFKFVSLYRIIQLNKFISHVLCVVNCFQICIFVSDNTTIKPFTACWESLWIAFKFVSLYRIIQPCKIYNIFCKVVNCFQICIFVSDNTTTKSPFMRAKMLWIAFKFVSLYRIIQPCLISKKTGKSCELLSNLYLCIG